MTGTTTTTAAREKLGIATRVRVTKDESQYALLSFFILEKPKEYIQ